MMALTSKWDINFKITYTGSKDLANPTQQLTLSRGMTLTDGAGADKGDVMFDDQRTLAEGANETIDLHDGSLTDSLGRAVTFDIVRRIYIKNGSSEASLLIGGAAATQLGLFNDTSDILKLPPGGEFLMTAPDATGIDVTTNAALKFEHDGTGTSSLTYDIIVVGED